MEYVWLVWQRGDGYHGEELMRIYHKEENAKKACEEKNSILYKEKDIPFEGFEGELTWYYSRASMDD